MTINEFLAALKQITEAKLIKWDRTPRGIRTNIINFDLGAAYEACPITVVCLTKSLKDPYGDYFTNGSFRHAGVALGLSWQEADDIGHAADESPTTMLPSYLEHLYAKLCEACGLV